MQIFQGVEELPQDWSASVVSIGNFDGVHLGHQKLLRQAVQEGKGLGLPIVVFTFYPHPVSVLYPERKIQRLFDLRDQRDQLDRLGITHMVEQEFTQNFAKLSASDFVQFYLIDKLKAKALVVGYDFSFGSNRQGDISYLEKVCKEKGIKLVVVPAQEEGGLIVSSSKIRDELKLGDLKKVYSFLGRNYYLRGIVHHGDARGRTIGVPTANMTPTVDFLVRRGVYITQTHLRNRTYQSITNIGFNPTFHGETNPPIKTETHIFDFDEDIYGQEIQVDLLEYLRDEKKFSGVKELLTQIHADIQQAKGYFHGNR
ncbi:bifunctional riboflavin kinase/FAD synthetase [Bdellovibrio sp. HCB337]|uniref:bifunctional riboflavin kinase/FAD synthetase n=1 Tax=Bdellovibrio sp. HCB337 TaxID=3394358 RepID=UPI0039A5A6B4